MIPDSVIQIARDVAALQARCLQEGAALIAMSDQASGPEAIGLDALADELDQMGKVLGNYLPRIRKHVGEIDETAYETFLASEALEGEDAAATRTRLYAELEVLQNRALSGPIPDEDEARKSYLTSNLNLGA